MSLHALRFPRADEPSNVPADRPDDRAERTAGKWLAGAFSVVLLGAIASPVVENWRTPARDDFPLSYYRMFSEERSDVQRVTYLVGLDDAGERFLLPYQLAGPGGMNQVRRQMNKLVEQGQASKLCRSVASRAARAGSRLSTVRMVEVITGTFRLSEYFNSRRAPDSENVRARCDVERRSS
jgi:hypothetical protein